jgi:hypothetical protein
LAAIRQKAFPEKHLQVPSPQLARSSASRPRRASVSVSDATMEGSRNRVVDSPPSPPPQKRARSTGSLRASPSTPPLPAWGSGGPSRYGRECITSCPVRTTPHNTSWGGCTRAAVQEKEGIESNRCSLGNALDRSWLYESCDNMKRNSSQKMNYAVPRPGPRGASEAPVLLGRCRGNETRHVHFA